MTLEDNARNSLKLRPITLEDFPDVLKWSKNDTFCLANDWELHRDEAELYRWWLHCVNRLAKDSFRLGIEFENKLIGYADLAHIKDNSAELGIAIGDSTLWGKGIGYNSCLCMMDHASARLGIAIFHAETHETNIRANKMLERIGFKEVGRMGTEEYLGVETRLIQYRLSA